MHANYHQMLDLLSNKNNKEAFVTSGFSNWKYATESDKQGFTQHESSKLTEMLLRGF